MRIVSDATFAPFHYIGDGGAPTGFDIELAPFIAERAGLELTVEVLPYSELFEGLSAKAHDVVAATTGWTAERAATYLFTEPCFVTCQATLVRVGPDEPATTRFRTDFFVLAITPSDSGLDRPGFANAGEIVSLCTSTPTYPLYSSTTCPP